MDLRGHREELFQTWQLIKDAIVLASLLGNRIQAADIVILAKECLPLGRVLKGPYTFMVNKCTLADLDIQEGERNATKE